MDNNVIVDNQESGVAKCGKCHCQFDYDVHSEINLEMDRSKKVLVLVCPACDNGRPICTCQEEGLSLEEMCEPCQLDHQEKLWMKVEALIDEKKEGLNK